MVSYTVANIETSSVETLYSWTYMRWNVDSSAKSTHDFNDTQDLDIICFWPTLRRRTFGPNVPSLIYY